MIDVIDAPLNKGDFDRVKLSKHEFASVSYIFTLDIVPEKS